MVKFESLSVSGFRRLQSVRTTMRPLCVMIGANGIGKTSVLDVFALLASSAQGRLNEALTDLEGLSSVLTYDRAPALEIGIEMTVPGYEPLAYGLELRPQGVGYVIHQETLQQRRTGHESPFFHINSQGSNIRYYEVEKRKLLRPNWDHRPLETSLSQVPKMFRGPENFRNRLASCTRYHALNVEARSAVRRPQPMRPATLPGAAGEELVSCLFYLREVERDRFEAVEDTLRAAFPKFDRLEFPPVAAGTLALAWREKGFSQPLYTHQLSEGTLRFLWLATLLQSPGLTSLTLLDEPEVSLHPELLRLLADLLTEASQRTQLVVATHSDRLLRFLSPETILLMDADEDGMASVRWADTLDLEEWLEDYTLDDLWSNGRLGARA